MRQAWARSGNYIFYYSYGALYGLLRPLTQTNIPWVARLWVLAGLWCLLRLVADALQDVASRHD